MSSNNPPAPSNNVGNDPGPPPILSALLQGFTMFLIMNAVQNFAVQRGYLPDPNAGVSSPATGGGGNGGINDLSGTVMKPQGAGPSRGKMMKVQGTPTCIWERHTPLDLHIYITDSEDLDPLVECLPHTKQSDILSEFHQSDLELASSDFDANTRSGNITVPISKRISFNETHLYAHVCLLNKNHDQLRARVQDDPNPNKENLGETLPEYSVLHKVIPLTKYKKRKRIRTEKSLLSGDNSNDTEAEIISEDASPLTLASANKKEEAILLYAKPSLTLQLIDMTQMPAFPEKNKIPEPIMKHIDWVNETSSQYYPLLYSSEFWINTDSLMEVNDTIHEVNLEINFENAKVWKWQLMSQMEESWRRQSETTGEDDAGTDMFRTMLLETNPILLAVTGIVSILHTLFDMLAFKNDIKFFKNKKSMHGLSLRTMVVNTFFQVVILLYLLDNDTSFMVLMSNGMGVVIEVWKISKAVKVSLFDTDGKVSITWKETETYTSSKTKEYDEIATDHLMFVTMPLVCGYGVYSLFYQKHRGWYSWIINTLVGFIYMFGFVMMTPQLFINYKLQSVAHLNWRTMTYKSINTFIDDLFAFIIKMPLMHRLACLRDDVIFLIFCYQKYKYKTDFTRVNEYGQCEVPTEEMLQDSEREKEEETAPAVESPNERNERNVDATHSTTMRRRRGARDKTN